MTLYDWCKKKGDFTLVHEWDTEGNHGLSPRYIGTASEYKALWRCPEGHRWEKSVKARVGGANCAICANRRVAKGVNDLATLYPGIAAKWNFERNGDLRPEDVVPGTDKAVWWRCAEHPEHEWRRKVYLCVKREGRCPYCEGRKLLRGFNDLATKNPKLAKQWFQPLNRDLTPEMVTPGSQKTAAWKCACGCIWYARIDARARKNGSGCPACAGQLNRSRIARYEQIAAHPAVPMPGEAAGKAAAT